MNKFFPEVKKNFGFGCMRLPMKDDQVDTVEFSKMVDTFLQRGFNYFDTAHGYLSGKSETALRECLTSRYPRDQYILTDKLSRNFFNSQEEIRPLFQAQLEACGVEYFDFYLMHAQNAEAFEKYKACKAYETAFELKSEGKIRHVGLSFHDKAAVLDRILTEYPQVEVVQIQFNYVDFDDPSVESKLCYDVCRKHDKPVIVMEPIKGGNLINLPEEALGVYEKLGKSPANMALRFAAHFDGMMMVLSGMSTLEQLEENTDFMQDYQTLSDTEMAAVQQVRSIFKGLHLIPCTGCRYCTDGCPQQIAIPDLFSCMNTKKQLQDWNADYYYHSVHTRNGGKASDCVKCGACEEICPQKLNIRELLEEVAATFEKKD